MRASSTLLVFVLAAVSSSPALAAPLNTGFCTRYPDACSHIGRDVSDDSGALSFSTIFDVGKGIFDVGKSLFGGSSNQQQQQRDVSGAINLSQLRGPELGPPVAFEGSDGVWRQFGTGQPTTPPQAATQPQRREFVEFMARAAAEADESGSLGIGTIFDIGKGIFDVGKEIFGGNNNQNRRDFEEFMARATAEADESGSLSIGTIFDIGKGIFDVGKTLFGGSSSNQQQQRRDFEEFMARATAEADESGSLGIGTIFDIGKGIFDVGKEIFGGNNQNRRDFEEFMARAAAEADDSGALGLGTIFDIGKGIFDVGKTLFDGNSNNQQSREFVEPMARSDEGAELMRRITLEDFVNNLRGHGPIMATRDFEEILARAAADDQSGSLGIGTIFDIGKGIFDVGKEIFGGNNQQQSREFVELLARAAADDESGSLGLGTIFDIGKGIFDVGKEIFGGSSNQQQSREFAELLARAAADDETGSLGLGTIFDIGKGIFDVGKEIFGGNNNQQSREFIEVLSRSDEGAELLRRSLADMLRDGKLGPGLEVVHLPVARDFTDLD